MATIKSFTSLEQSKKLAEILPLESADMRIGNYVGKSGRVDGTNIHYYPKGESFGAPEIIYAWSLAALLNYLKNKNKFPVIKELSDGRFKLTTYIWDGKDCIQVSIGDSIVDACYELILKLNELNLL